MKYKILWIDATTCKQPGRLFPHYRITANNGEWKDLVAWDFFECNPLDLRATVLDWQEKYHRSVEIFSVSQKYSKGKVILTEEDL